MDNEIDKKIYDYLSTFPKRIYPKNQIIIMANQAPEHIFYLTAGRVRKYDISFRGEEVVVNVFKPGSFFPMSWAINQSENSFFYKTEMKTELHVIPPEKALEFLKQNPDVMLDLLSRLYRGMEGLLTSMVHLMGGTARTRIIHDIITNCRRFGTKGDNGEYVVQLSEVDISAHTGLTRETVSREIQHLKKDGSVTLNGKQMTVDVLALGELIQ